MEYGNISVDLTQLKKIAMVIFSPLLEIYCDSVYIIWISFLIHNLKKNVNFECISIAQHIINLFNEKLIGQCICKLVRKSYTPVVPIANTCSIGYLHDGRADNAAYLHDRRADNAAYRHDRHADSLSRPKLYPSASQLYCSS